MLKLAKNMVPVVAAVALLVIGTSTVAMAAPVPEIDPSNGVAAIAFIAAAVLVIRGRHK